MAWCETHSWRAFCVRLGGLGPNSALAAHLSSRQIAKQNAPQVLEDPDEVRRAIMGMG